MRVRIHTHNSATCDKCGKEKIISSRTIPYLSYHCDCGGTFTDYKAHTKEVEVKDEPVQS